MPNRYLPKGVRTANMPMSGGQPAPSRKSLTQSFITISQQTGAECFSLPERVAQILTALDPTGPAWSHWDQELVEKISQSQHIPAQLINSLELSGHSWIDDMLTGISGRTDEMVIFHAIKQGVRELARGGRVVLVGHGSVYLTRDLPGGLHVRLIAPMAIRTRNVAARFQIPPEKAMRRMRRLDRQRQAFFNRFWPDTPLSAELFAATLNTKELDEDQLTRAIVALLPALVV